MQQQLFFDPKYFWHSACFRWEVCAEFINQHSSTAKTAKEVLAKAKEMQSGNFAMSSLKEEVNKLAYENLQKGVAFIIKASFYLIWGNCLF